MPITKLNTERGTGYQLVMPTGTTVVHFPGGNSAYEHIPPVLDMFADARNRAEDVMKPDKVCAATHGFARHLYQAARLSADKATETARSVRRALDGALVPPDRVASVARAVGPEVRTHFRGLDHAGRAAFINGASPVELAALLDHDGALSGLDPTLHELARDRALVAFHIERTALASDFPAVPSLNRIIATGTDNTATVAAAEQQVADLKRRVAAVEDDEAVLQHLVRFIADATETTPAETLERILAAD